MCAKPADDNDNGKPRADNARQHTNLINPTASVAATVSTKARQHQYHSLTEGVRHGTGCHLGNDPNLIGYDRRQYYPSENKWLSHIANNFQSGGQPDEKQYDCKKKGLSQ